MMRPDPRSAISNIAVVIIATTMSSYFTVNTVVMSPCTINLSMAGSSAVACASSEMAGAGPRVSYSPDPGNGDMVMTVEF